MIKGILVILVTNVTMQTGNGTNHNNGGNIRSKGKPSNHRTIRNRGNMVTIETRGTINKPDNYGNCINRVNRNNRGSFD